MTDWSALTRSPGRRRSRSINAENPTGAPGQAAMTASALGPSRKGRPAISLESGETATLADITGPGTIRHLWMTVPDKTAAGPWVLRDLVLRMWWDDDEQPAVEVPLGDFFCNGFGQRALVTSEPIVVAPTGGLNSYFPMPFHRHARIELTNEHPGTVGGIYYQIDYTVDDELVDDTALFHAHWRRSNASTAPAEDHVILDGIVGSGNYVGTYIGLTALERFWWGEGEVKFYLDDDEEYPSQCSTGLEDYAGGAWAFQDALRTNPPPVPLTFSAPYCGYPFYSAEDTTGHSPFVTSTLQSHGMYRWHLPDPVIFHQRLRITLQQIGAWDHGHFERSDDISSVAYWYQLPGGANDLPSLPSREHRRPR
ncbi:glycoside hydrolase family 172 protein [Kribbella sp. NPDC026596]|uniref:glycoside hydrolase family 172 protein n=1 Tax=Kribbella sp. NPDC026596 TaxID=3155122 RepID=UPI0033E44C29